MSEWKEFTGSPEQIEEIQNSKHGYCVRMADEEGAASCLVFYDDSQLDRLKTDTAIFQYLIAEPHPLADMICQQARTGQPVCVKTPSRRVKNAFDIYKTTKPNWYWTDSEFSFTPFEEEYYANK